MSQHPHHQAWSTWPGWSMISAGDISAFTLWLTGLPSTGKTTLATLVKKALMARGYKVDIVDNQALSRWLQRELHIEEDIQDDSGHTISYDTLIIYVCSLLARNGIISIASLVSPCQKTRNSAREQLHQFIEVYLHRSAEQQQNRLHQHERTLSHEEHFSQLPTTADLEIDTGLEAPERSALRVIAYLEQHGYIAPLWEDVDTDEEIASIKMRLQALGYLE